MNHMGLISPPNLTRSNAMGVPVRYKDGANRKAPTIEFAPAETVKQRLPSFPQCHAPIPPHTHPANLSSQCANQEMRGLALSDAAVEARLSAPSTGASGASDGGCGQDGGRGEDKSVSTIEQPLWSPSGGGARTEPTSAVTAEAKQS